MDPILLMQYGIALGLAGGVGLYIWNARGSQGMVAEILLDDRNRDPKYGDDLDTSAPFAATENMRRRWASSVAQWKWNGPIYYTNEAEQRKRQHDPVLTREDHMPLGDAAELP